MIDINSVPLTDLWIAEGVSWVIVLVLMLKILPTRLRLPMVAGVVAATVIAQVFGVMKRTDPRTLALMVIMVALSVSLSSVVMRRAWTEYLDALETFGERSRQERKSAVPLVYGIVGMMAFFTIVFLAVFKGIRL